MLTTGLLKRLKQVNVSKDAELTKVRLKEDFSGAKNASKRDIETLAGQKRASLYRAYNTGAVNARLVLAMAQTLNVTPFYYTGEDEKKPLEAIQVLEFLKVHGYTDVAASVSARLDNPKPPSDKAPTEGPSGDMPKSVAADEPKELSITLALPNSSAMQKAIASLTEEDAVTLLKALLVREKLDVTAEHFAKVVKWIILSK